MLACASSHSVAPIAGQTNPGGESGGRGEKKSSLFLRIEKKQWAGLEAQTFGHNQERMRHCSPLMSALEKQLDHMISSRGLWCPLIGCPKVTV